MERFKELKTRLNTEIARVVIGQEPIVESILIALLVGGHVLLEGPPGIAKTLLVKTLARTIGADYNRVQFTPDLMPLDLTGTNIFNLQQQQFVFRPGPIFTDLLLADEINRTPPKTQAALLEAMEERQVTIDGQSHSLSPLFTVFATQNPIEFEGTYPLPEAQQDRFLFKLLMSYPQPELETQIYQRYQHGLVSSEDLQQVKPLITTAELLELRRALSQIQVRPELIDYNYQLIKATRENPFLALGASPRAGICLLLAAQTWAALQGRDYLTPDDLQEMAYPVLRHRLLVKPEALIDGKDSDLIIKQILSSLKIPR